MFVRENKPNQSLNKHKKTQTRVYGCVLMHKKRKDKNDRQKEKNERRKEKKKKIEEKKLGAWRVFFRREVVMGKNNCQHY